MPDVSALESANRRAWPALEEIADGNWVARFALGHTNRSNSIQIADPADSADAPARLARLAGLYRARKLTPVFRVTPLTGAPVADALDRLGWTAYDESIVMRRPLDGPSFDVDAPFRIFGAIDAEWAASHAAIRGFTEKSSAAQLRIQERIADPAGAVLVYDREGEPAAATLAVVVAGIGFIFNVATHPERRRQGLGRAAVAAALAWAKRAGAREASLAVAADNVAARPLYEGFGFSECYRYHYCRAPAP